MGEAISKYHEGVEIQFDEEFFSFWVPDLSKRFDSFQQAKDSIESKQKKLTAAKKERVSLKAIDDGGREVTITGFHAGHGGLTTKPKLDRYAGSSYLYPATKDARVLHERAQKAQAALDVANDALRTCRIPVKSYGNEWHSAEQITKAYDAAAKAAKDEVGRNA